MYCPKYPAVSVITMLEVTDPLLAKDDCDPDVFACKVIAVPYDSSKMGRTA